MSWLITIFICFMAPSIHAADLPVPESANPYAGYYHAFSPTRNVRLTYRPRIKDGEPLPAQTATAEVFSSNDCKVTTELRYGEEFHIKSGERLHVEKYHFFDTREIQIVFRPFNGKTLTLYCNFPLPTNRNLPIEKLTDKDLVSMAAQNLQHSLIAYTSNKALAPAPQQGETTLRGGVHQ